jgi:hypothetical protein
MTGETATGGTGPNSPEDERRPEMTTIMITARYACYLLTSLSTVAFRWIAS